MTFAALLFMSAAVLGVIVLTGWCYYRVLTSAKKKYRAH